MATGNVLKQLSGNLSILFSNGITLRIVRLVWFGQTSRYCVFSLSINFSFLYVTLSNRNLDVRKDHLRNNVGDLASASRASTGVVRI